MNQLVPKTASHKNNLFALLTIWFIILHSSSTLLQLSSATNKYNSFRVCLRGYFSSNFGAVLGNRSKYNTYVIPSRMIQANNCYFRLTKPPDYHLPGLKNDHGLAHENHIEHISRVSVSKKNSEYFRMMLIAKYCWKCIVIIAMFSQPSLRLILNFILTSALWDYFFCRLSSKGLPYAWSKLKLMMLWRNMVDLQCGRVEKTRNQNIAPSMCRAVLKMKWIILASTILIWEVENKSTIPK